MELFQERFSLCQYIRYEKAERSLLVELESESGSCTIFPGPDSFSLILLGIIGTFSVILARSAGRKSRRKLDNVCCLPPEAS